MLKESFDGLIRITKIVFVEFFNIFFFDVVYDALDPDVDDGLLKVECLLEFLHFCLEVEKFAL